MDITPEYVALLHIRLEDEGYFKEARKMYNIAVKVFDGEPLTESDRVFVIAAQNWLMWEQYARSVEEEKKHNKWYRKLWRKVRRFDEHMVSNNL